MPVKPVPEGYHTLTPYLTVRDAERAIEASVRREASRRRCNEGARWKGNAC